MTVAGFAGSPCLAGDVMVSLKAGNWNDATVWQCGRIPSINDEVYINHAINLPVPGSARTLILGNGYVSYQNNTYLTIPTN